MSKMSELSMQLDELKHCGEILIGISDSLREMFSGETEPEAEKPVKKAAGRTKTAKAAKEAEPEVESPKEEKKPMTLEEVRTILAEKSRAGFTEEVKQIIGKHGANRLSEIDPADYEAVAVEAEVLGDA